MHSDLVADNIYIYIYTPAADGYFLEKYNVQNKAC